MEFGRYLLGELLCELQKFEAVVPGLTDVPPERLEVLSYSGYTELTIQSDRTVFTAQLDWSAKSAPKVIPTSHSAT